MMILLSDVPFQRYRPPCDRGCSFLWHFSFHVRRNLCCVGSDQVSLILNENLYTKLRESFHLPNSLFNKYSLLIWSGNFSFIFAACSPPPPPFFFFLTWIPIWDKVKCWSLLLKTKECRLMGGIMYSFWCIIYFLWVNFNWTTCINGM